jgi:hypothetical protein
MIINNLNVRGAQRPFRPIETNSPLIVNANTVLAFAITFQGFKSVAGQGR